MSSALHPNNPTFESVENGECSLFKVGNFNSPPKDTEELSTELNGDNDENDKDSTTEKYDPNMKKHWISYNPSFESDWKSKFSQYLELCKLKFSELNVLQDKASLFRFELWCLPEQFVQLQKFSCYLNGGLTSPLRLP